MSYKNRSSYRNWRKMLPLIFIFILLGTIQLYNCSKNSGDGSENKAMLTENIDEIDEAEKDYLRMPHSLNVVYKTAPIDNGKAKLQMDIYYPTNQKYDKSPLVVGFHGGGWIAGDRSQIMYIYAPVISELLANGYTVATVQYRYANNSFFFPSPLEDCIDAILYLKKNSRKYNIDTESIGVMGYSAGAQLAMLSSYAMKEFSTTGETVDIKYCISSAGPSKMYGNEHKSYTKSTRHLLENLFNGKYAAKVETYKKGSPYFYLDSIENPDADKTPKVPLLLIQDTTDDVVPFEQSQVMFDKAAEIGMPCELIVLSGVGHNIDFVFGYMVSPTNEEAVGMILDFIYKYSGK